MTDYSMFDFWFAGGEGKVALRAARNDAHREAASGPRVLAFRNRRPIVCIGVLSLSRVEVLRPLDIVGASAPRLEGDIA
jgi:hypothetical protein